MTDEQGLRDNKIAHLRELQQKGVNPYPYRFVRTHESVAILKEFSTLQPESFSGKNVAVAGRIMVKRGFGKLVFLDVYDGAGKIQVVLNEQKTDPKSFDLLSILDTGDFIGVHGEVFATKRGEISVMAKTVEVLSKSIAPLPEKWHGLKDIETRYRNRPLDLIVNHEIHSVFVKRAKIIQCVRDFLNRQQFLDVEIPILQPNYGGANARPFITTSHAWKSNFYLSISPELYLKRLLVGGFERVFTITKNFRNEDVDKTHNPEFTMMESYAAYWDYNDVMKLTEDMFEFVAKEVNGTTKVTYEGKEIDLKAPWARMTMADALKKFAKLDVTKLSDAELKTLLKKNELEVDPFKRGLAIAELFGHLCEPHLIQPTFIIDHPKETTPLCKPKRGDPELIERFEAFINTWEMANAYSELNDPLLQESFFKDQADQGRAKGETHPPDSDYVEALKYGMPPAGGLGIGIDRMVMLLTSQPTIKDVLFFPQMKPEHASSDSAGKSKETLMAVALINTGLKLKKWEELNTAAHLNAALGARMGKSLLFQEKIPTSDGSEIALNIQHAIMMKSAKSGKEILALKKEAEKAGLTITEFTREMIQTTNDKKVMEQTKAKKLSDIEFLGILVFGKKSVVEKLTESFPLYS